MTGAYAQEWSGRGAWAQTEWGREGGPKDRGRCGSGEHGRHGGHGGHGRHRRHEDTAGQVEALLGWAFARAAGKGGHGHNRPTPEELEELIALRRMRGGPFGGPGRGGRGRGRGRARRGDVRLAVLRLLAEEPRNGYQLMQTIEERSGGRWRPSPGSMYPTLSQLEDETLIRSTESDGSRRFEITDAGRDHLDTRAEEPAPWEPTGEQSENAMSELGPLVIGIGKAVWQVASVADEKQRASAIELLDETRRSLYRILAEQSGSEAPNETDEPTDQQADESDQPES